MTGFFSAPVYIGQYEDTSSDSDRDVSDISDEDERHRVQDQWLKLLKARRDEAKKRKEAKRSTNPDSDEELFQSNKSISPIASPKKNDDTIDSQESEDGSKRRVKGV